MFPGNDGRAMMRPSTGCPSSSITLPEKLDATLGREVASRSATLPTKTTKAVK
jgi:hypothetical protein